MRLDDVQDHSPYSRQFVGPNLFTLLYLIVIELGCIACAIVGYAPFGYVGGFIGAVSGTLLGYLISCTCDRFLNRLTERGVRKKATADLRAELVREYIPGTYISSLIISVLLERGEPADSFREYIFRQLRSEYHTWRKAGFCNLNLCYPDLAKEIEGFDLRDPTNEYLIKVGAIDPQPSAPQ